MDGFTALRCSQCGGKVEVKNEVFESDFKDIGDGEVIFRSFSRKIVCEHCGTEFLPKTVIEKYDGNVAVVINTGGGAHIGGSVIVSGGDFVGRDSVKIQYNRKG